MFLSSDTERERTNDDKKNMVQFHRFRRNGGEDSVNANMHPTRVPKNGMINGVLSSRCTILLKVSVRIIVQLNGGITKKSPVGRIGRDCF